MANGISIDLSEFRELNSKEQNTILFQNTEYIKNTLNNYSLQLSEHEKKDWLHQKIAYLLITILAAALGITKFIIPLI